MLTATVCCFELYGKSLTYTHYVTGSRAFTQTLRKIIGARGSVQFKYFNSYAGADNNAIDILIADESHRIRTTSESRFTPKAKRSNTPQIDELLKASKVSVFFIDDKQIVRPNEIGSSEYIKQHSLQKNCKVFEYKLEAQFRCNGSDAFVNWVNNTLGIERTANVLWGQNEEFDFRIYPTPISLEKAIREKSTIGHTARLTAGFCWSWSMPNPDGTLKDDVVIGDYRRPWDAKPEARRLAPGIPPASLWAYDPNGINQIGCIYTAQGFEFDYVGVIFGEDLVYDFDAQRWVGVREKSADNVVKRSRDQFTDLVKNTYRVLLSRGMKGCYVCFLDKDTERFFRSRIETAEQFRATQPFSSVHSVTVEQKEVPVFSKNTDDSRKFISSLPIYSLKAAAGKFLENQDIHEEGWIDVDIGRKLDNKMFVARVVGDSMEPEIPNGSYCVFRAEPVGSRQGKIVLVCHQDIHDVDNGGAYTVKKYWSKKVFDSDGTWRHKKIVLESLNKAYEPIIITEATTEEFRIIAEFVEVLKA